MEAENLVNTYEQTMKNMKCKLDSILWKLKEFEKQVIDPMKNKQSSFPVSNSFNNGEVVSVSDIIQNQMKLKNDCESLRAEMKFVEESLKDTKFCLNEELDCAISEHYALMKQIKDR
ncbi:hypothetical protein PGB90_004875 [Kerria lacca]